MAFPTLYDLLSQFVLVIVGFPLIYILSKAFKIRSTPIVVNKPRKEAAVASVVIASLFLLVFGWVIMEYAFQLFHKGSQFVIGPSEILWRASLDGICLVIIMTALRGTRQTFASIGIGRNNIGRMLALGLALSAIFVSVFVTISGGLAAISPQLAAYGFVLCISVGFGEEMCWRGYVQTRVVAYFGKLAGLVTTSLLFAVLWHFPGEYFLQSGAVLDALAYTLTRVAPGMLFGYIMLRCQNILPASIFHVFWDWGILLGRGHF